MVFEKVGLVIDVEFLDGDGHHDHDGDAVDDVFFAENQPLPGWRQQPQQRGRGVP